MENNSSSIELELAWLLKRLPKNIASYPSDELYQGYLFTNDPKIHNTRLRRKGEAYTKTVKYSVGDPAETGYNNEDTVRLPKHEFEKDFARASQKIHKTRYYMPISPLLTAEIDLYHDNLEGLAVVEVEFPTLEACRDFKKPSWFGKEVTDSPGIYPPHIADLSLADVHSINKIYRQKPHRFT